MKRTSSGSSTPFSLMESVKLAQIAQRLAGLVRIRPNLIHGNHAAHRRAAETGQRLDVMRVMPHLQCDWQPDPLRHVE